MKVLKFGGTSVGSAQRMKDVAKLITDCEQKIVVLSAMSGTTNTLVEISDYLYKKNPEGANEVINKLEAKYKQHIEELYSTEEYKQKTLEFVKSVFDYIRSYTKDIFTLFEEKVILAQGEIISTNMVTNYLCEQGVKSNLIPALEFMRTDKNSEPDLTYIREKLAIQLEANPTMKSISLKDSFAVMHTEKSTTSSVVAVTTLHLLSEQLSTPAKSRSGQTSTVCMTMIRVSWTKLLRCASFTLKKLPNWLTSVQRSCTRLAYSLPNMPTSPYVCSTQWNRLLRVP